MTSLDSSAAPRPKLDSETARAAKSFLQHLAARYQVREAILFGSRARHTHRPDSDADIAVVLDGAHGDRTAAALDMGRHCIQCDDGNGRDGRGSAAMGRRSRTSGHFSQPSPARAHPARGRAALTAGDLPSSYLRKAQRALFGARLLFQAGDTEGACNRAYYAMFDAPMAQLRNIIQLATSITEIGASSRMPAAVSPK